MPPTPSRPSHLRLGKPRRTPAGISHVCLLRRWNSHARRASSEPLPLHGAASQRPCFQLRAQAPRPSPTEPAPRTRAGCFCAVQTAWSGSQANLRLENQVYGELGFEQETELP